MNEAITETDAAEGVRRAAAVVSHIASALVDQQDAVGVEVDEGGPRPAINVTAADGEMGRLIGRRGRTANAIRTVGRSVAARDGAEVDVEFLD